jgi:hypothetical protein
MVTKKNMQEIFDMLIEDESFCRFLAYGKNPLDESKDNIVGSPSHEELMKKIINFAPQIDTIEAKERVRVCLYKSYTKFKIYEPAIRDELIQIDIYCPHELVKEDMRPYDIENIIVTLLEGKVITGIGSLLYVDGSFVPLPSVSGYAQYKMIFSMQQGRATQGMGLRG